MNIRPVSTVLVVAIMLGTGLWLSERRHGGTPTNPIAAADAGNTADAGEQAQATRAPTNTQASASNALIPRHVDLPPLGTPVAAVYQQLAANAYAGDVLAACRLGAELGRCRGWQRQRGITELLNLSLDNPTHQHIDTGAEQVETLALLQLHDEQMARHCAGVDDAWLKDAIVFQRLAAQNGSVRMRLWYAAQPALDRDLFLDHLDEWRRYRQLAPRFLDEALQAGDPMAPGVLADVHQPPSRSPLPIAIPYRAPDAHRHFVYRELADQFTPRPASPIDSLLPQPDHQVDMDRVRAEAGALKARYFAGTPVYQPGNGAAPNVLRTTAEPLPEHVCVD